MPKVNNFEHIVTDNEIATRLDKLLVSLNEGHARHQVQMWIKNGIVRVNEKRVKPNYKCRKNDRISWYIKEKKPLSIEPEPISLTILYEDESLLVINKPSGLLVHPTEAVQSGTLVNALKYYTNDLSTLSGIERPGIVHRLDQYTSGAMVVCKNDETHAHLKSQFKQRTVTRIYETIVYGVVSHEKGVIKAPIGRNPKNRLQMAVVDDGKEAETRFTVLGRSNEYTHVQCELITGRTHQIRIHMKYMNHPIVGDPIYSRKKTTDIQHQALFAKTLGFIHPETEQYVEFSVEQPQEFVNLLKLYHIKS